ncbi:PilN domain-containing protein [Candidatus Sumerlaeota bacterium]|nr:PilN domain-containing protein [Candidatus Sumerlaeota bacterium]
MARKITASKLKTALTVEAKENELHFVFWINGGDGWNADHESRINVELENGEMDAAAETALVEQIQTSIKTVRIKPQYKVLILPKQHVTLRETRLPTINDDEVAKMARFEAEKQIPFNPERYGFSHHISKHLGIEGSEVLIAAIESEYLQRHLMLLKRAGIEFHTAICTSQCLANLMPRERIDPETPGTLMLVNVDRCATDLVLFADGRLKYARSVKSGWESLFVDLRNIAPDFDVSLLESIDVLNPQAAFVDASRSADAGAPDASGLDFEEHEPPGEASAALDEWMRRFFGEMHRTWNFARREANYPPLRAVIIGGLPCRWQNLQQAVAETFSCECVSLDEGWNQYHASKTRDAAKTELLHIHFGALAQALNPKPISINLLPDDYLKQQTTQQKIRTWSIIGAEVFVLLILCFLAYNKHQRINRTEYQWYVSQNKKMEKEIDQLQKMKTHLDILETNVNDKVSALAILNALNSEEVKSIPESVTLTMVEFQRQKELKLRGHSRSIPEITEFRKELKDTNLFINVEIVTQSKTHLPRRPDPIYEFTIDCEF